jgi:rRNA maturation endonuclease Nob1
MDFENYPCETVIMKIMAESNKPIEVSDIRNYCSDCGTRMKKQTWKFCPNCGSKID